MDYLDYLFLLGRIVYGWYFLMNGWNHFKKNEMLTGYAASKGVPVPKVAVYASGALIFLGGLGVLAGVYTEWALTLIVIFLVVITFKMHVYWKTEDPNSRMVDMLHFWKNLGLLGASLMLYGVPTPWLWPLF